MFTKEDVEKKLKDLELNLKSPLPLIVIQGLKSELIPIDDKTINMNLEDRMNNNNTANNNDVGGDQKFRGFIFINCESCQIHTLVKTTKLIFLDCHDCQIQVGNNVLGAVEVIRSSGIKLYVNAQTPLIQIDLSSDIRVEQIPIEIIYVATSCMDVKCYFKSSGKLYTIPCTMFKEQHICLINENGFDHVVRDVVLNSVEQHVMLK